MWGMTEEQKEEILEGRRRSYRFWLWGKDVHVTLFIYNPDHIWVWIMCSCYPYRLRECKEEDHYRCSHVLEAHWRAHEYLRVLPLSAKTKAAIDEILAREGIRLDVPPQCPIG